MEIDLTSISEFLSLPPDQMLLRFLLLFGWIPIAAVFLWGFKEIWMNYIQDQWAKDKTFTLLAIDIPKGNAQSPRAVENIFTYLAGAHSSPDLIDKYWLGYSQLPFSLEIVSIDGYTQFLIHTPEIFRNLVESAIYSQYPDAEITEVNDYTTNMPNRFPDSEYDLWGAEFGLAKSSAYPIKRYEDFIHQMGPLEEQFNDPMASLMDLYSSLVPGEQAWFQIVVTPIGFDWTSIGDAEISKILGEKKSSSDIVSKGIKIFTDMLWSFSEIVIRLGGESEKKQEDNSFKMFNLKPKEKKQIEGIQEKISKVGLQFKTRYIYIAKKDVFKKPKGASGFVGFIKQFADMDLNNLKPDKYTSTSASYFFVQSKLNSRKTKLINNYKNRDSSKGGKSGVMNVEELATLWHFPIEAVVKAPLIQKTPGKKSEPPMGLPVGEEVVSEELFTNLNFPKTRNLFADEDKDMVHSSVKRPQKKRTAFPGEDDDIFAAMPGEPDAHSRLGGLMEDSVPNKLKDISDKTDKYADRKGAPPNNLPFG